MKEPWEMDDDGADAPRPSIPDLSEIAKLASSLGADILTNMKKLPRRPLFAFTAESLGTCIMRDDGMVFIFAAGDGWIEHSALPGTPAARSKDATET